jgi:hypothetical protein
MFVCSTKDPLYACSQNQLCLSTNDIKSLGKEMDSTDLETLYYGFDNIGLTLMYLIQVGTFDRWWTVFLTLQYSEYSSLMINFIYILTLVTSLIIHGFLIANFMDSIILVKKKDHNIGKEYRHLQSLTSKFTAGLLAGIVEFINEEKRNIICQVSNLLETILPETVQAHIFTSEEFPKDLILPFMFGKTDIRDIPPSDNILHRQYVGVGELCVDVCTRSHLRIETYHELLLEPHHQLLLNLVFRTTLDCWLDQSLVKTRTHIRLCNRLACLCRNPAYLRQRYLFSRLSFPAYSCYGYSAYASTSKTLHYLYSLRSSSRA